jgi:hypothetical protein
MKTPQNEPWLERSLALLDQSAEALDAATQSKLTQARHAALAQPRLRARWIWGAAAACAVALVLAIGIAGRDLRTVSAPPATAQDSAAIDALASDDDNLDMVEDLDFYAWLDAQQHDGEG